MYKDNVLKTKSQKLKNIFQSLFVMGIIFLLLLIISAIILCFMPKENFNAVKESHSWYLTYNLSSKTSFYLLVPYKIIQPLSTDMFSAKSAFLTFLFSTIFIKLFPFLYGIKLIIDILKSTINDYSPFNELNVKNFKRLAYIIIFYSVLASPLISILCCIFVTKIFLLNLGNINLYGLLAAASIFILSDIFKYGVYLQNRPKY